jgi:hypothetical protein
MNAELFSIILFFIYTELNPINERRQRSLSNGRKKESSNDQRPTGGRSVLDIKAQDLLGKSHEELVLLLIHLRRQSVALGEAIDGSKVELDNYANSAANNSEADSMENKFMIEDVQLHINELEEKLIRTQPIINLVDNMVKLGSLYKGRPADSAMTNGKHQQNNKVTIIKRCVKLVGKTLKNCSLVRMYISYAWRRFDSRS